MPNCIFCEIVAGNISAKIVYEDDKAIAFEDINPQAPVHIIIIPKKHIATIFDIEDNDLDIMGYLYFVAKKIASTKFLDDGFRLVINCGRSAGQEIQHIHMHLLGGRTFGWPPG